MKPSREEVRNAWEAWDRLRLLAAAAERKYKDLADRRYREQMLADELSRGQHRT